MKWMVFPDPATATEEGLLATGGELSLDYLVSAYAQGVFPWPHEGYPLLWFCPQERGILEFCQLHIPRSLKKWDRKELWTMSVDRAFRAVIESCAQVPRPGQPGTWIHPPLIEAYCELHREGYAHSLEVWEGEVLVGGIYGVYVKNVFSAESMFYRRSNASKWALWKLVEFLKNKGLEWMDVQMITPVTGALGATPIQQKDFLSKLHQAQALPSIPW